MGIMRRTKSLDLDYSDVQFVPWPRPMLKVPLSFITNAAAVLLAMLASLSFEPPALLRSLRRRRGAPLMLSS